MALNDEACLYDMGCEVGFIAGYKIGNISALIDQLIICLVGYKSVDEIVKLLEVTTVTKEDVLKIKQIKDEEMIRNRIESVLKKHGLTENQSNESGENK